MERERDWNGDCEKEMERYKISRLHFAEILITNMKIIIAITYYRIILKKHESLYHLLSDILLFTIMRKEIIFFLQRAYFFSSNVY